STRIQLTERLSVSQTHGFMCPLRRPPVARPDPRLFATRLGLVEEYKMRHLFSSLAGLALLLCLAAVTRANSGTLLPLDQYQAGTEQVQNTIVSNGNFENTVGNQPVGWAPLGTFQSATPTGPNTSSA